MPDRSPVSKIVFARRYRWWRRFRSTTFKTPDCRSVQIEIRITILSRGNRSVNETSREDKSTAAFATFVARRTGFSGTTRAFRFLVSFFEEKECSRNGNDGLDVEC